VHAIDARLVRASLIEKPCVRAYLSWSQGIMRRLDFDYGIEQMPREAVVLTRPLLLVPFPV